MRLGFEAACESFGVTSSCVLSCEIDKHCCRVYAKRFQGETPYPDIRQLAPKAQTMSDFDVLLAGFPCQPFSRAGKVMGFEDTRGTLFFDLATIIREKRPKAFLLENVSNLVSHGR